MQPDKFPITPSGYKKLETELQHLKVVERPAVINAIAEARAHGDLSENAEYTAAREKQGFIEAKILDLENQISRAMVIDMSDFKGTQVKFGARVTLLDEESEAEIVYTLVGNYEANLNEGRISIDSPLAKALIGKNKGDNIEVTTPRGTKYYEIILVEYV
ncbi:MULTISPECIES: transcription elongation factor GreA [unclassified Candidatus Lariskella]|uniref:transcription elongation factor GreA n=1 Tax=unclassified Candidatus Lariskella TaxID=2632605 RepID=UPI0030CB03F2